MILDSGAAPGSDPGLGGFFLFFFAAGIFLRGKLLICGIRQSPAGREYPGRSQEGISGILPGVPFPSVPVAAAILGNAKKFHFPPNPWVWMLPWGIFWVKKSWISLRLPNFWRPGFVAASFGNPLGIPKELWDLEFRIYEFWVSRGAERSPWVPFCWEFQSESALFLPSFFLGFPWFFSGP